MSEFGVLLMASIRKDTTWPPPGRIRYGPRWCSTLPCLEGTLALASVTASSFTLGFQSWATGSASSLRTLFFRLGVVWPVPTHVRSLWKACPRPRMENTL